MTQLLAVDKPCTDVLAAITAALDSAGLDVRRSFDLRDALAQTPDCACPYHGKAQCDCEYVVLLVYAGQRKPTTLVVHGNNGQSWVMMPHGDTNAELKAKIVQILSPESLVFQT